jgi:beta-lactamase regulating signal transducer with metallopeptidase domain
MASVTWWLFQNIVITTVLVALVAVICRAGRVGPVARHALWVLVLVKFVTPPLVVWPWAAPDPFGIAAVGSGARDSVAPIPPIPEDAAPVAMDVRAAGTGVLSGARSLTRTDDASRAASSLAASAWPWFLGIWVAGSLLLLSIEGVRLVRLARRMRAARDAPPADPALVTRIASLSARLGIRPVPVVLVAGLSSPAVWGFGRPRLLWPADLPMEATDACIDGLLVHELAHVKRGDHLVGWIELGAGIAWWWNPLFWFVRSALREQAELACDAWVISALPNGRRAYAESLLALSGAAFRGASPMAMVGVRATSRRVLERRLVMIMQGRVPLRLPMVGLFCLALAAAATLPAWAASQQPPPPPPPPVPVVAQAPPTPPVPPARPAPAIRAVRVPAMQTPPKPPTPSPVRVLAVPSRKLTVYVSDRTKLPAEGQTLLDAFEKDREAIQLEAEKRVEARREGAVKALEALQDQLAKAGKLDEAVAIRDYLRAGGPGSNVRYAIKR